MLLFLVYILTLTKHHSFSTLKLCCFCLRLHLRGTSLADMDRGDIFQTLYNAINVDLNFETLKRKI